MLPCQTSDVYGGLSIERLFEQEASSTPVFGSASTFGADKGFGGFSGTSRAAPATQTETTAEPDQAGAAFFSTESA